MLMLENTEEAICHLLSAEAVKLEPYLVCIKIHRDD